jgi:arylsulfatase A-like enzyme
MAAVLAALLLVPGCTRSAPPLDGAVLILIDTLRADHLGAYGHARPTSPEIDGLAARGALFEQTITTCSWTLPAVSSLLSGRALTAAVFDGGLRTSLVEPLRSAGLHTAAFTEGGFVSAHFGLDRGFEHFEETEGPVRLVLPGGSEPVGAGSGGIEHTFARAEAWLRKRPPGRFFLLVHTYEVHAPYRRTTFAAGHPRGALGETFELADVQRVRQGELTLGPTELAYLDQLYDGGVRSADDQVGQLLGVLGALGLTDRTLVVLTADHGEDLGGRDARFAGDHGHTLYEEQVRIPLIVMDPRHPEWAGRRISSPVRILDVMPTILDLLGVARPAGVDGRSLVPLLQGRERAERPALIRLFPRGGGRARPVRTALREGGYKLVVSLPFFDPQEPAVALYDLRTDPGERTNLADRDAARRDAMLARLEVRSRALEAAGLPDLRGASDVPEGVRERLHSLGYTP